MTFVAVSKPPMDQLQAVGTSATLVMASRGGRPVLTSGELTRTARAGSIDDATSFLASLTSGKYGAATPATRLSGALPMGITLSFRVTDPSSADVPHRRFAAIDLWRVASPAGGAEQLEVGLVIQDVPDNGARSSEHDEATDANTGGARETSQGDRDQFVFQQETAILNRPLGQGTDRSAVVLPFRLDGRTLVAVIEVSPGSHDPFHELVVTDTLRTVNRSAPQTQPLAASDGELAGLHAALRSLDRPGSSRPALVFVAVQTGAHVCEDLTLVADEATLVRLSKAVRAKAGSGTSLNKESLGFAMEVAAFDAMNDQLAAGKLAPELAAVLTLRAGEAGRHPDALSEVLRGATSTADLDSRLVAQNYIFLEDNSPASRVRAFDWLKERGRSPGGYDPLASSKIRRAALEKALAAPARPVQPGGGS